MDGVLPTVRRVLQNLAGIFPLSWGGVVLAAVLYYGVVQIGLKRSDLVILIASGSLAVAAVLTLLAVVGTALVTLSRFRQTPTRGAWHLVAGHRSWTEFQFSPPRLPLVEVDWECVHPHPVETVLERQRHELVETLSPERRGLTDRIERRIWVRDVLGVASVSWTATQLGPVEVLPAPAKLQVDTLVQSLFSGDDWPEPMGEPQGDRVDMRRYTPGDPPRLILWKVYARTGKLMVRVPERAVVTQPRTCAYVVAGPHDEACASLMRAVLEQDLLGSGWRFGADGSPSHTEDRREALTILARSGNPGVVSGQGLASFLKKARSDGYGSCLVVVPPQTGAWSQTVAEAIKKSSLAFTVLSAASNPSQARLQGWQRLLFFEEEGLPEEPERLFESLPKKGVQFLLYDRHQGRVFPDYHYKRVPA